MSGGIAWPAVGVVGGGEASTAAQPATKGRSRRHDLRCFVRGSTAVHGRREQAVPPALLWRLEQEDQRLKKHNGHWIDIQRLRLLESFVDVYNK